jgi:endo-1,4-beta-xylanase
VIRRSSTLAALVLLSLLGSAQARTGPVELGTAVGGPAFIGDPDPRYRQTLTRYDSLTAENDMKMFYLRPSRSTFNFAWGDAMVDFAQAHGQQMHGHTLVWCNDDANPLWLEGRSWSRAQLLDVMREHISTVVAHYRGRVSSWDVVNEALADDGSRRDCLWQRVIGDDWVEQAFRMAREADSDVRLFYNEVRADTPNPKYEAMLGLARDFLARGVPLDGIGLQYHLADTQPPQDQIEDAIRRIGELGLAVHISELDVPIWYLGGTLEQKLTRQADAYRRVAAACQAQPACFRITTWGFTDRYTYRCCNAKPLPFDEEYRPKPAWAALQEVLRPGTPSEPPPENPPAPTPPPAAPVAVQAASTGQLRPRSPLALSASLRRARLRTWLRRGIVAVSARLSGADSAGLSLVLKLGGRVLGHSEVTLRATGSWTFAVPLSAVAKRRLARAAGRRIVLIAVATDPDGRRAETRVRLHVRR